MGQRTESNGGDDSAHSTAVVPSTGWGVLHLFLKIDRERIDTAPGAAKLILGAIDELIADGYQVITSVVLGHKADLAVMALGPDLARLAEFENEVVVTPLHAASSYLSLTEGSEYSATEHDERARLAAEEGLTGDALEVALTTWSTRMAEYRENRLHPQLPMKRAMCFYPMSKRRGEINNWYALGFEERKALMAGHGRVGRKYAGRILQLITGSTGLDDFEWGVTLFSDDPAAIKEIVYEMRFDEITVKYGEFGSFYFGLVTDPTDALRRVGLIH